MSKQILDYSRFYSEFAKHTAPSVIRKYYKYLSIPGMISLAGGLPNGETFPYQNMTMKLKDGSTLEVTELELKECLNYSSTEGMPLLHNWIREHQETVFKPPLDSDKWKVCLTNGSQDAFTRAFYALVDKGDPVMFEDPTYTGALTAITALQPEILSIPSDQQGILPDVMEDILKKRKETGEKKMPKFLYIIPNNSNPSGITLNESRRKKIYKLACEYDFLILEDDPYYYLSFKKENQNIPTFLSMDVEGRVLRFDSFSKLLSAGFRLGYVTGPTDIVNHIITHIQSTSLNCSGPSQIMSWKLLQKWKENDGFQKHIEFVREFYKKKCQDFSDIAEKHLKGLATWNMPSGGMFLWMKLADEFYDSREILENELIEAKVLLVPGQYYSPLGITGTFIRCSFSLSTNEEFDLAMERLAKVLKEYKKKK